MFGNCDDQKMLVMISNEWPQGTMQINNNRVAGAETFNNIIMASSSSAAAALTPTRVLTAHQGQQQQSQPQQQPQPLKCPRCDSSNTKFCYYNNYSLSQPRHFCKACKRYWTRGGTLRNVPVGGGCRKNKRVKRPPSGVAVSSSSSLDGSSNSTTTSAATTIPNSHQISHFSSSTSVSNGYMSPLFYGLQDVAGNGNFPVIPERFINSKVSSSGGLDSDFWINGLNALELGFLPLGNHANGLINNSIATTNKQELHSSFNDPLFGSLSSSSPTPSVAALLGSTTLHHQKLINGGDIPRNTELLGSNHLQTLAQLQDLQVGGEAAIAMNKEGKLDHHHHQISGHAGLSDPSMYSSWNAGGVGVWLDPTGKNIGSSLTSLI